jgi:uncharacterized membrane protein YqiK
MDVLVVIGAVALVAAFLLFVVGVFVTRLYHKVEQGSAMVVNKTRSIDVTFSGALIMPVVHKAELMDISVKRLQIARQGKEGLICRDNIRADIDVSFYVRVNPTNESVLEVAKLIGCAEASNPATMDQLFGAKFSEALKTVGKQMDFVELYEKRDDFRHRVIQTIGQDLNGYLLDDVAIEYLEQTPLAVLDPHNILDAEGIRKITEITTTHRVVTNELNREAEKKTKAKDVETTQAIFELDRQEKAAEYRATREMATTKAREEAATAMVEAEERLKAETARLTTDEQVGVRNENLQREVSVAAKNRERVVAVEEEKVTKARELEVVTRQIETTAATKDLELTRTEISTLAKDRVAGERAVAEQEEAIKSLRVVEEANRGKEAIVIKAGADAEAILITEIKTAEAAERAADHRSRETLTLATADQKAADLEATAMARRAEGAKATAAAPGLAQVEVSRAEALAIEQRGLAEAKVKEADATAETKRGLAIAESARAAGAAEAESTELLLKGEAAGLSEKAAAMRELEGVGQQYEQFVRTLDANKEVALADVEARKEIARAQAEAVGTALASANVDIVGGADVFVDRVIGAVTSGRQVDAVVNGSETLSKVAKPYLNGEKDILALAAGAIAGLGSEGMANLTLAGLLTALAGRLDSDTASGLGEIVEALKAKGLDQIDLATLAESTGNSHATA